MDIYIGMRIIAFGSFVLGVSTFTLCGWTYLSNHIANLEFGPTDCLEELYFDSANETVVTVDQAFNIFRSIVLNASAVVMTVAALQILSAAVIIGSALQGSRERAKIWFGLNLGVNLVLLLCPLMTVSSGAEYQEKFPTCFIEMRNQILHLDSFYVGVGVDFIVQFHALIACLLMLRFDRGREYQLVEMT